MKNESVPRIKLLSFASSKKISPAVPNASASVRIIIVELGAPFWSNRRTAVSAKKGIRSGFDKSAYFGFLKKHAARWKTATKRNRTSEPIAGADIITPLTIKFEFAVIIFKYTMRFEKNLHYFARFLVAEKCILKKQISGFYYCIKNVILL